MSSSKLIQYHIPGHRGWTEEMAKDATRARRYAASQNKTLPGDIKLQVTRMIDSSWLVKVYETQEMPR